MIQEEIDKIRFPSWFRGITKNHISSQENFFPIGFDTETCYGKVFALGISTPSSYVVFHGLNKPFLKLLAETLFRFDVGKREKTIVAGAHNLGFDLGCLIFEEMTKKGIDVKKAPREINFKIPGTEIVFYCVMSRPCFGHLEYGRKKIYLLDTYSFFQASLEQTLKAIGSPVQKQAKPKELGKRIIPLPELQPYLKADCEGSRTLVEHILSFHKEYNIKLCVSLPQMASRIFRHYYVKKDFVHPNHSIIKASLFSYHGGKNYPKTDLEKSKLGSGKWFDNVTLLDVRSAFPEAMVHLPDFQRGEFLEAKNLKECLKHEWGIFEVSGYLDKCKWGCLYDHGFNPLQGKVDRIWVTSYELRESIRSREFLVSKARGYYFNPVGRGSPFRDFVRHFYKLKEKATDPVRRNFYKGILNSLYGKFIQRTIHDNGIVTCGSMFDPFIGSLITGFVRAKLHRLEHKYNSIHTATDGFMTLQSAKKEDLGDYIGDLKIENFGKALIVRNKLYIHYNAKNEPAKWGLHGFQGSKEELIKIVQSKKYHYRTERLVKWGEAWHIGYPPGFPLTRNMKLNISTNN
jgi:hypothetical protein